jgi:hypothetical protein
VRPPGYGWYVGTLAPFNGNSSPGGYSVGLLFDNCLINPASPPIVVLSVTNSAMTPGVFEIETSVPHGLYTGAWAIVEGTAGAAGLNGTWVVTAIDPTAEFIPALNVVRAKARAAYPNVVKRH